MANTLMGPQTQGLLRLLQLAHSPGPQMAEALEALRHGESRQGFGPTLLQLISEESIPSDVRQASAIYFKNFIKRCWLAAPDSLANEDRAVMRQSILPALLPAPRPVRLQLCAALEEMADLDFPADWPSLLQELAQAVATANSVQVKLAGMAAAHYVFLRFRSAGRCGEVVREARSCADAFGPAHLLVWRQACAAVIETDLPADQLDLHLDLLLATGCVFYDLNAGALSNFFSDNCAVYFQGSLALLRCSKGGPADSAALGCGRCPWEQLKGQMLGNLTLCASQYSEQFQPFVADCLKVVWDFLVSGQGGEQLTTGGMSLLAAVATGPWTPSPFEGEGVLQAVCETVVLPNLQLSHSDVELFREDPREFICRDLEGGDQESRRRVAVELIRSLRKDHNEKVSAIVIACVSRLLEQAAGLPLEQELLYKDACLHMVMALAGSVSENTGSLPGILDSYFSAQVAPELKAEPVAERALLRAACLKFITVFRGRLPVDAVMDVLPGILRHVLASCPVVHTYAAHCFNGLTAIQEYRGGPPPQRKRRFDPQALHPFAVQVIPPILQILLEGRGIPQNEHLAQFLTSILDYLDVTGAAGGGLAQVAVPTLTQLTRLLASTSGPLKPEFIHDIFDCVALVLRGLTPDKVPEVEVPLFPVLSQIWERRVEDLLPYCLQILGLMLDVTPMEHVKPFYEGLFKGVLLAELWRGAGNVPGIIRFLRAFFAKHQVFGCAIRGHMQVVFERFEYAMGHKKLAFSAFGLLNAMFRYLPWDFYQSYFQAALSLVLARLQAKRDNALEKECSISLFLFAHVHSEPGILAHGLELLQPGLFERFLVQILLPGACRVVLLQRRKICVFGLVKLMSSVEVSKSEQLLLACCGSLAKMLRSRGGGILDWLSTILATPHDDEPEAGKEFEVSYNRLRHAELSRGGLWDPLPEIQDMATGIAAVRAGLAPLQPAIMALGEAAKPLLEILTAA